MAIPCFVLCAGGLDFRRTSLKTAKQLSGIAQPPASRLKLLGVSAVLVVSVWIHARQPKSPHQRYAP
jgi:hypothetical protein